jgi:Type I phosphodiesterase / nucleotide pyrophosphatase
VENRALPDRASPPTAELPGSRPSPPRYGERSLSDLGSSLLASLGVPGEGNPLGLPPAARVCLLVVDGLGWELLRAHPAAAPFLSGLAVDGGPLTVGFPATTVTSLSSLGTGRPPGQHGMLGYQVAVPGQRKLLNGLRWDKSVDPLVWQPGTTIYERAAAAGVSSCRVGPPKLEKTGLSAAVMRGNAYRPAYSLGALAAEAAEALRQAGRALVTVYHDQLDGTGHVSGCGSDAWRFQLGHVDKLAEQLAAAIPAGTQLYVTADHGMVDVAPEDRVDVDTTPGLLDGVALLGGEARARHLYTARGAAGDVRQIWRGLLGDRAWVLSRDEAIAAGWFGPVEPRLADRIGDVVVAPAGSVAVVATRTEALESSLIGMHGSLTSSDQLVPLLCLAAS